MLDIDEIEITWYVIKEDTKYHDYIYDDVQFDFLISVLHHRQIPPN